MLKSERLVRLRQPDLDQDPTLAKRVYHRLQIMS